MVDEQAPVEGTRRRSSDLEHEDPISRLHSDVARYIDIFTLRSDVMAAVAQVGSRVDGLRDDFGRYVVDHAQLHSSEARELADRWDQIGDQLAVQRGLVSVFHFANKYRGLIGIVIAALVLIAGFLSGSISIGVGAQAVAP